MSKFKEDIQSNSSHTNNIDNNTSTNDNVQAKNSIKYNSFIGNETNKAVEQENKRINYFPRSVVIDFIKLSISAFIFAD
jgi:hypothetical protein